MQLVLAWIFLVQLEQFLKLQPKLAQGWKAHQASARW